MVQAGRDLQGQSVHPAAEYRASFRVRPAYLGSRAAGFHESPKMDMP